MFLAPTIKKPKENQCFTPWRPMGSPWGAHGAPQGIQDSKIELYEFPWPPGGGGHWSESQGVSTQTPDPPP